MRRREFSALSFGATFSWPFLQLRRKVGRKNRFGMLLPFPRDAPQHLLFLKICDGAVH